jgi:NADH:quinone reductase (non-electrogenic)
MRILMLGAGLAGLWSAVAAARRLDELGVGADAVEVLIVNRTPWHAIRVRNYEADIDAALVPLADVLDPIGVKHIVANVMDIDIRERTVACAVDGASNRLAYDRLVFALGCRLARPPVPGLEAATVVWCAGMQADPSTTRFPVARDRLAAWRSTRT